MSSEAHQIAVLLPCYNEENAIKQVIEGFQKALPSATIYVYDNASDDNTVAVARAAGATVRSEPLRGKSNVVRSMFRDVEADYYIMADGDGSYDSSVAAILVERCISENLDMLIGVRHSVNKQESYRRGHLFGNQIINKIIEFFFDRQFEDLLSGYRVFSRRFVKSACILSEEFELEVEMTIHAMALKLRIEKHPVTYFPRAVGTESKLRTYRDGFYILLFIFRLFKDYRPLVLFSSISLVIFVITLFFFIPILVDFLQVGTVSRIPTLIMCGVGGMFSLLSLFTGFVLDSIARTTVKIKQLAYMQAGHHK